MDNVDLVLYTCTSSVNDKIIWALNLSTQFSSKLAYKSLVSFQKLLRITGNKDSQKRMLTKAWNIKLYQRYKIMLWMIDSNVLLMKGRMRALMASNSLLCLLCSQVLEIEVHILQNVRSLNIYGSNLRVLTSKPFKLRI